MWSALFGCLGYVCMIDVAIGASEFLCSKVHFNFTAHNRQYQTVLWNPMLLFWKERETNTCDVCVCVCVCFSMNAPVMVNLEGETDPLEVLNSYLYRLFLLRFAIAFMVCCFVQEKSLSVVLFVIAFPACLLLFF
jgi:hypothetical protein